jgi:AbrB family looped-hinge helix DNA binding protein
MMELKGPDGKYLYGIVKVGTKGQIVIPKEARDRHGIKPGDQLAVGGDENGIAIFTNEKLNSFLKGIMKEETQE